MTVDYARSFLPVAALVLVLRSFIFEPFRIPSDSMMPTLEEGDFPGGQQVRAYGLRLPVLNTKFVEDRRAGAGRHRRVPLSAESGGQLHQARGGVAGGDRGPGTRRSAHHQRPTGAGQPTTGRYNDGCYLNMRLTTEQLGTHRHQTLSCHTSDYLQAPPVASCNRHIQQSYQCEDAVRGPLADRNDTLTDMVVPPGQYLMIGDNRDNSLDGRFWGFVPEDHLVGRAARIWLNLPLGRSGWPDWHRIGKRIE